MPTSAQKNMRYTIDYLDKLLKPFIAMYERADTALPFAALSTISVEALLRPLIDQFFGSTAYGAVSTAVIELTMVDIKLVIGLFALVFIDMYVGIRYSKRVKAVGFSSFRLRDTNYKLIEYGTVCIVFVIFSNMAGGQDWIKTLAFTYLAGVEVSSIMEKSDNPNVAKLFQKIRSKLSDVFDTKEDKNDTDPQ